MTHRAEICYLLSQIGFKIKAVLGIMLGFMREGCTRTGEALARFELGRRVGELVGGIRARFSRSSSGTRGMDDDGSTMMQGLLMQENM